MIDIHSHFIPNIDDGVEDLSVSLNLLKEAEEQGVSDVICTPHYRKPFLQSFEEVNDAFSKYKNAVNEKSIKVNLYLGREVYSVQNAKELFQKNNFSMNGSKYILMEFSSYNSGDIAEVVYEMKLVGFIPIVAHIERYSGVDFYDAEEIKASGGLIQVNADSIVGDTKGFYYKKVKQLLKAGLVDFVASDMHDGREYDMGKAYRFVLKKFGSKYAEVLFNENAKKILEG